MRTSKHTFLEWCKLHRGTPSQREVLFTFKSNKNLEERLHLIDDWHERTQRQIWGTSKWRQYVLPTPYI
jgi:hypothetical protein